jgi:hypothetical protein
MEYYNKVLNGNMPLGVIESLKENQNNYNFKEQYSHYQIRENMSNVETNSVCTSSFKSDIDYIMNSYWGPVINKSLQLNRDKILAGINTILTKSLKLAIEHNKDELFKIGLLTNNDSVQIKRIINLIAKMFGEHFLAFVKELNISGSENSCSKNSCSQKALYENKVPYNLSDLHIKLVHLSGLTGLSIKEIDNIATNLGLELELSLGFKVNTSLNIVHTLYEILTPQLIKSRGNNLSYDNLFSELYISKLSQIVLGIWESILENIMTLSKYKQISFIYAFSVEFADTLFQQSKLNNKIIENFGVDIGNSTTTKDSTKKEDISEDEKTINRNKQVNGMNKFLSSAINSAVNDNKADLLKSIAASNKIKIGSASTSAGGFTLSNIKQANKVDTSTEAKFVQKIATKVVNDVGNKLKEAIDMATKESSDSDKKLTSDEKSGTSVGDVVGQVAGAIGDTVSDVLSVSIGNSTNTENSAEELKKVMKKYTLNENVEVKKNNEVTSALSNVFKSENLSKCAGNSAAANELDIGKIDVNGPIVISEIDQSNVINDVMKCAFDQEVMNDISNKILNDFENLIKYLTENISKDVTEEKRTSMKGDILAAGAAGAALCESAGKGIASAAEGVGKGVESGGKGVASAAVGVGSGIESAGKGVASAAEGIGTGIGSAMTGLMMPLIVGGIFIALLVVGYAVWKYASRESAPVAPSAPVETVTDGSYAPDGANMQYAPDGANMQYAPSNQNYQ